MKAVNQPIRKKDAMALVTGKPVFMDDLVPKDCLIVKLLRSPHANAIVKEIDKTAAEKVPGIEAIYTWEDVPQQRFTTAGQTYPEATPYDRLILDQHVRFVGDPVAIIAGEDEACVEKAMRLIKVKYEVLPAILDFHVAKDNEILVHPEDNWRSLCPVGADNKRNLCATARSEEGDVDGVMAECDTIVEHTYHTVADQQAMMETFRTYCSIDAYGRLNIFSSTQIVFHVRRIVSNALGIPKSQIRVSKPRVGGGFGAKQTAVSEVYPAFVTWMTKKPSKIIFTRVECQIASSPRHEMEVHVKVGADEKGIVKGIKVEALSNAGAYGDHSPTTIGLTGHKAIALYRNLEAYAFDYEVVYTNVQASGAYRGYGATQGIYAVESAVNELAHKMNMDPARIRELNMPIEGEPMYDYDGNLTHTASCTMDRCLARAKEMIGWDEKYPCRDMGDGKVRSVGIAMAMQGSCISNLDVGSATIKVNDDGGYTMLIAAADMGTGCDTILSQMAAECLECDVDDITVVGADTDTSPYDSGSYASSTTYITGKAVEKACMTLRKRICALAAERMNVPEDETEFTGTGVVHEKSGSSMTMEEIATAAMCNNGIALEATESNCSPVSPPPYMAGAVEIELDKETGEVRILDYAAVVDCGTVINPNLARVQVEGGLVQGIGMTLFENIQYTDKGQMINNSFMQYKVPTRLDMGRLRVEFRSSYEPTGPFGAKSIGEIVINTPAPALAHAIYNATGLWFRELPITSEQIAMGIAEKECE